MTDVEKQADAIVHAVPRLASESGSLGLVVLVGYVGMAWWSRWWPLSCFIGMASWVALWRSSVKQQTPI